MQFFSWFRGLLFVVTVLLLFNHSFADNPKQDRIISLDDLRAEVFVKKLEKQTRFAHENSDFMPDDRIVYGYLDNGMRYALVNNKSPKNSISFRLRFDTGSFNESDQQAGLAHFLEHMAFNGSENVPEGQMVKIFERLGVEFGADNNAYTNFDETVYKIDLARNDQQSIDTTFMVLRETVSRLTLSPEAIERERGVILAEKRLRDSPMFESYLKSVGFLYPETTIFDRFPIGKETIIKNAGREFLVDYYRDYYTPGRAFLVIVGDMDLQSIEKKIKTVFSDWKAIKEHKNRDRGKISFKRPLAANYFYHPEIKTNVTLYQVNPARNEKDTLEKRYNELLKAIGFSILERRFDRLLSKKESIIAQAYAYQGIEYSIVDQALISVTPADPAQWEEALYFIEKELRRALKYGFLKEEVDESLANFTAYFENQVEKSDTFYNDEFAGIILNSFSRNVVVTSPVDELKMFDKLKVKVTPEEVQRIFRNIWESGERLIYVESSLDENLSEKRILKVYNKSKSEQVSAPKKREIGKFAYETFNDKGIIKSLTKIKDLDITQVVFNNNVRLSLKKTDFQKGAASVSIRLGRGLLSMPKSKPGLDLFANMAFIRGGLKKHRYDQLKSIFAGKKIIPYFYTGYNNFYFSNTVRSVDLFDQMKLISAYIKHPGWHSESLAKFRQNVSIHYAESDIFPEWYLGSEVPKILRSGDGRFGFPKIEKILQLNLRDLKDWLDPVFSNSAIEMAIVGDIDIEETIDFVALTLGALPERRKEFDEVLPDARKIKFPQGNEAPFVLNHNGSADRAITSMYWPLPDWKGNIRIKRKNYIFSRILEQKLLEVIREQEGADYSPYVEMESSIVFPDYGFIGVILKPEVSKINFLYDRIFDITKNMKENIISEDLYQRTLKPVLEDISDHLSDNDYLAEHLSEAQSRPEVLDDMLRRIEIDYKNVSISDIKSIAENVFRENLVYRISILPSENKK